MVKITEKKIPDKKILLVEVDGALEGSGSAYLEEYLIDLIDRDNSKILLNAAMVSELGSAGIGLLLYITDFAKSAGGSFVIFGLNYEASLLIERLGVDKILHIAKNQNEALKLTDLLYKNAAYEKPLIIKCRECLSLVRIKSPGEYMCHKCLALFRTDSDMKAIYN